MKLIRKAVVASLGLLPFIAPADIASAENIPEKDETFSSAQELPWRKARFSIEAQTGSRTIGTLDAFVPFMGNDDFLIYANLMARAGTGAKNSNGNSFEGNAGLGFRRVNDSETAIYGAYVFYDQLKSVNDNTFSQITVGAERLGLVWDFRANAYLPIGQKEFTKTIYDGGKIVIDKHNLIEQMKSQTEVSNAGGDIEVGRTLGTNKLRGYFAAYSFGKDLTGPRLRLEYQLTDNFTLTGAVQYDKERGTQYLLGARFSIGGARVKNSNSIYNRLTENVVRDLDVVTNVTTVDLTQVEKDRIWFVDGDNKATDSDEGDGTFDNPYAYLDDAVEAAPEGAIIFVKGHETEGVEHLIRDVMQMKQGQTLWGGSESLYWDFATNKPVTAANSNALLIQAGVGERQKIGGGIIAADNVGIYNFDIFADGQGTQADQTGITISNANNVTVANTTISGFKSNDANDLFAGIKVSGDQSSVNFDNVTLNDNDIGIDISSGVANFNNITINDSTQYGIYQTGGTVNAQNISINNTGTIGFSQLSGELNASSITINGSGADGISQLGTATINVANDITINNVDNLGIESIGTINAGSINIDHTGSSGIHHHDGDIHAGDIQISNTGAAGIENVNGNIFASSIFVDTTTNNGIDIIRGKITTDTLTANNAGETGILVYYGDLKANVTSVNDSGSTAIANIQGNSKLGDVSISNAGDIGINVEGGKLTTTSININTTVDHAISQTGGAVIGSDITIKKAGLDGINQTSGEFNAASINIEESSSNGIYTNKANFNVSGTTNVSDNGQFGIFAEESSVNFGDISANNNINDGVMFKSLTNRVQLGSITANGNGESGVNIVNSSFDAESITANNNGNRGIDLYGDKNDVTIGMVTTKENADIGLTAYDTNLTINKIDSSDNRVGVFNNSGIMKILSGTVSDNKENGVHSAYGSILLSDLLIEKNGADGIKVEASNSFINLSNSTVSNNGDHGLEINGGATGILNGVIFENNGLPSLENAKQMEDLSAAILATNATLTANHIVVRNNAAGIEFQHGKLTINESTQNAIQRSIIDGNTGYGIWIHQNGNDINVNPNNQEMPDVEIYNTDIKNTKAINQEIISGHGIFSEDINQMSLANVSIIDNEGTGLWIESGDVTGDRIELSGNGQLIIDRENTSLENITYGLRVDQKDGMTTNVDLDHVNISNSAVGLLVNGGEVNLPNAIINENRTGAMLTQGTLNLDAALITDNTALGLFARNYNDSDASDGKYRELNVLNSTIQNTESSDPDANFGWAQGHGIVIDHDTKVTLTRDNIINNEGYGIWITEGTLKISGTNPNDATDSSNYNSHIDGNAKGGIHNELRADKAIKIDILNTTVSENGGIGIAARFYGEVNLDTVLVEDNALQGLDLYGRVNGDLTLSGSIKNSIVRNNGVGYSSAISHVNAIIMSNSENNTIEDELVEERFN